MHDIANLLGSMSLSDMPDAMATMQDYLCNVSLVHAANSVLL